MSALNSPQRFRTARRAIAPALSIALSAWLAAMPCLAADGPALAPPSLVVQPSTDKPAAVVHTQAGCTTKQPGCSSQAQCTAAPRPFDQIWIISSQGCPGPQQPPQLQYWQYAATGDWITSSPEAFLVQADPAAVTTVWIHGNRVNDSEAKQIGLTVYRSLLSQSTPEQPMRFIIWSWPAEQVTHGPLEDARIKAARTPASAYALAWLLNQFAPDSRVSLLGYSFGARIATGSLHLLGGGNLGGYRLPVVQHPERIPMRAVLLAAAIDNYWLLPGRYYGLALGQVEQMLLLNNSCDRALRFYPRLVGRHGPQALGYTGLVGGASLGPARAKIVQFDACCIAGKQHDWSPYFRSAALLARMRPYVFFEPIGVPSAVPLAQRQPVAR